MAQGPGHPEAPPLPTQNSACILASWVSGKFSSLLRALEMQHTAALRSIDVAKTQVLAQARDEEQRLRGHLEAVPRHGCRIRELLEQVDEQTFLQVRGLRHRWGTCFPAP